MEREGGGKEGEGEEVGGKFRRKNSHERNEWNNVNLITLLLIQIRRRV
jgi:hypothetical protein